ncbi:MAG: polysaccharide deacetylase family protein [Cellulosilyticaceae bacterium]
MQLHKRYIPPFLIIIALLCLTIVTPYFIHLFANNTFVTPIDFSEDGITPIYDIDHIRDYTVFSKPVRLMYTSKDPNVNQIHVKLNDELLYATVGNSLDFLFDPSSFPNTLLPLKLITFDTDSNVIDRYTTYVSLDTNASYAERSMRVRPNYEAAYFPISKNKVPYIPILMYHHVVDYISDDDSAYENSSNSVTTKRFEEHLQMLQNEGYTTISLKDLKDFSMGIGSLPEKPVLITSDDGYLNNYTHMYPLLQKYNNQATFFVTPNYVGDLSKVTKFDHFSWEQALEMEQSGLIDIQSHSANHLNMKSLSDVELHSEVLLSFALIEQNLGKRDVKVFAYPEFKHNLKTKLCLNSLGIDFQMTKLTKPTRFFRFDNLKRIHVHNDLNSYDLLQKMKHPK